MSAHLHEHAALPLSSCLVNVSPQQYYEAPVVVRKGYQVACSGATHICLPVPLGVHIAPWLDLVRTIPFSATVFVAGSAATWLAEWMLTETPPVWSPGDVDIFVLHDEVRFNAIVSAYITRNCGLVGSSIVTRHNIVDIKVNSLLSEPVISFVRCCESKSAGEVVAGFDIDVCKVCLGFIQGHLSISMQPDVARSIELRRMRCIVHRCSFNIHYPLSKTILRVQKYRARGFRFASLTFISSCNSSELNVTDFIMPIDAGSQLRLDAAVQTSPDSSPAV